MATDFGLNPTGVRRDRVVGGKATVTGLKYGYVVTKDTSATGQHLAVKSTTTAGDGPVAGIVSSQTDPTNGSAVGDTLEICNSGTPEVFLAPSQTIVKGDKLVTSTTAGCVKKLAGETGNQIIVGAANMDATSGASPILIGVDLGPPFGSA